MTALQNMPAPAYRPAPVAYRLLNAASHCPQPRDYLLKLAGLHFPQTSETVRAWQDEVFSALVAQRLLTRNRDALYSLTRLGEARLSTYFEQCGPLQLQRL